MTGCRHGAKNTLVKNYLYLAEQAGAGVHPLTTVTRSAPEAGGYEVHTAAPRPGSAGGTHGDHRRPGGLAAAALGTQRLLHRISEGHLPHLSDRLGELTRTNSEAILGATRPTRPSTSPRAWRSRPRSTPTSTPTSSRSGTARAATRWGCSRPCSATAAGDGPAGSTGSRERSRRAPRAHLYESALVGADGDRARDADPRQLAHHVATGKRPVGGSHVAAGPRRTEPHLDPGRQRPCARSPTRWGGPRRSSPRSSTSR